MENQAVKRAVVITTVLMTLATSIVAIEWFRPGKLLCPLRRVLEGKLDIEIPEFELNASAKAKARADAARWKQQALQRFPDLAAAANHPAPEEQSGLSQWLAETIEPTSELRELWGKKELEDVAAARAALAANQALLDHALRISRLTQQSSSDLPASIHVDGQLISAMHVVRTLRLAAKLAALDQDAPQAMAYVRSAGNLVDHLHGIESTTYLSEIVTQTSHLMLEEAILESILPSLGRHADLAAWQHELQRHPMTPQRLAATVRGEWQCFSDLYSAEFLAEPHYKREMPDPEAVAMSYAEMCSRLQAAWREATWSDLRPRTRAAMPDFSHLSPEGRELLDRDTMESIAKQFLKFVRRRACHMAAIEWLMLEATGQAPDPAKVTHDPLSGQPLVFDPSTRTLALPPVDPETAPQEPLKLPW